MSVPTPFDDDGGPTEQLAIDLGPGVKASPWKLPPLSLLERAETHEVDKRAVLYELVTGGTSEAFTSERRRDHVAYR